MDRKLFFDTVRAQLGSLAQSQVDGFTYILDEAIKRATPLKHLAYMLATTWWETGQTMQPVREKGGERYLKKKPYYPWVGEGLVQVTWESNHRKFGATKPGQLMKWPIALRALFDGMTTGMFTGKKLSDYINARKTDYKNARRIINGTDQAAKIAGFAKKFEGALDMAGYGKAPLIVTPSESIITPLSPPSLIADLQTALNDKNYPSGKADGKWGKITRDAVLSFKADHDLDTSDAAIDLNVVLAAEPRVIETRAEATVATLREREEPTVKGADQVQTTGVVAGSTAAVAGGLTWFETFSGWWRSLKTSLAEFGEPGTILTWLLEHWYLPTMGMMGIGMIILARRQRRTTLQEFKSGNLK